MAIITFWNGTEEQCGTTSSAVAFATQVAIEHNIKVLLISTSLNDSIIKDSFWKETKKSVLSFMTVNNNDAINSNGIEGLDRIIRSNKITPDIITDYTKIVLSGRLEVLTGIDGTEGQYDLIKDKYAQIIAMAGKYYDMVIVDLNKRVGQQAEVDILKNSDIIVSMIPQRKKQIEKIQNLIKQNKLLKEERTLLAIGKYIEGTKYNAKNITRTILKKKEIVNTIPYSNLFFEASQEGKVVDLFLSFMLTKDKDESYTFVQELKRLYDSIQKKISMLRVV